MPRRVRSAFSLVELIAASVVLVVAVAPMFLALREAQLERAEAVLATQARFLAEERLEDIIADRHSASRGWSYLVSANYGPEWPVDDWPAFRRTTTLSETGADLVSPGTGFMVVSVEVSWDSPRHGERSLTVTTVLTEYASP